MGGKRKVTKGRRKGREERGREGEGGKRKVTKGREERGREGREGRN